MTEQIITWSHSSLGNFEKCRRLAKFKHINRIPEPDRPLPPGKTEHANDRGSRVHDNCESYVRGDTDDLCPEAEKHFGPQIDLLRVLYAEGLVSLEGEWGMSRDWGPHAWNGQWEEVDQTRAEELGLVITKVKALPEKGTMQQAYLMGKQCFFWVPPWLRLKLDVLVFVDPTHAVVIDYKTGRKFGNEGKHGDQVQLYQLVVFLRYPQLEHVTAELWYLDVNEVTSRTFTRKQGLLFKSNFDRRGNKMTTNKDWSPNPNKFSCKWCPYGPGPNATGDCQDGIQ